MIGTTGAAAGGTIFTVNETVTYGEKLRFEIQQGWNQVEVAELNTETSRTAGLKGPSQQ